jgi:thiamine-phosphate pyrophosphorylase
MSRLAPLSPLYAILDTGQIHERPPVAVLEALLRGGVAVVQLRAKELTAKACLSLARQARLSTLKAGTRLIVNDRLDIALASGADGVHLGQEDLPLDAARRLMGNRIIGISTHDLAQAIEAERGGADYIGFGPIFATATKETGYAPRGLAELRQTCRTVRIPVVAIGGISEKNIRQVWAAGAAAAAMISELMGAEDAAEKARRILSWHQEASSASSKP